MIELNISPISASLNASVQEPMVSNLTTTAGQMLKQARTEAGLHIAALAVSLHVPIKRIEALENDQIDQLPDLVFARALTSSICQTLKINSESILDKLPKAALPRLNRDDIAINAPIGFSGTKKDSLLLSLFTSPWVFGVFFLILGSVSIYFWPKATVLAVPQLTAPSKILPDTSVGQSRELIVSNANNGASNLTINAITDAANIASHATDNTSPSVTVAAASISDPNSSNSAIDQLVTFKATGETWVEVKNSSGATVLKKLLNEGESAGATGVLPLTVIVGRVDVTQVEVRGKRIDLAAIAKSNVARFEVN